MSVPAYVALEKEPDERSSSLRRQMNKETEGNGIHGKESLGGAGATWREEVGVSTRKMWCQHGKREGTKCL